LKRDTISYAAHMEVGELTTKAKTKRDRCREDVECRTVRSAIELGGQRCYGIGKPPERRRNVCGRMRRSNVRALLLVWPATVEAKW
jgi:hypothetical protein